MIGAYRNGNYDVAIMEDGTKIRCTMDDHFDAVFPENIDVKITNYCDMNCKMCHEASSEKGKHGDILNAEFIETLHPYTEIAIGGGNPLSHPDLVTFLMMLNRRKVIANITVNETHFVKNIDLIRSLVDKELIHGLGISYHCYDEQFFTFIKEFPNAVVHTIVGVNTPQNYADLAAHDIKKILILGYKQFRRGIDFYKRLSDYVEFRIDWLRDNIKQFPLEFEVVSFDNLAIEQLKIKDIMSEEKWAHFYMGDDGKFTMYIDLVGRKYARNSTSTVRYDLSNNIDDMFAVVKNEEPRNTGIF